MSFLQKLSRYTPGHFVALVVCFFIVIPAHLLKENVAELSNFDPRAFLGFLVMAAGALMVLSLSHVSLAKLTNRSYFSKLVEFSMFVVIITGFFLPASKSTGMQDPNVLSVDKLNLLLAVALAAIFMFFASRQRRLVYLIITVFVGINTALALPAIYSLATRDDYGNRGIFELSSTRNIIVLSFDGVPGPLVSELLHKHQKFRDMLTGFVFFERAVSSSPATDASTAASLYGNRDFKGARTDGDLWRYAPDELITNRLTLSGYDVSTYGVYNSAITGPAGRNHMLAARFSHSSLTLLNYSIARTITRFFVIRGRLSRGIEVAFDQILTPPSERSSSQLAKFAASNSPRWKKEVLTPTFLDFHEYLEKLHNSSERPVAHFLHFTYTHFPVEFDRRCQFQAHDKDWFIAHQDRQSVTEEAYCVLGQISNFLARLEELHAFDNSLVVLKSDHGKPVKYNDPSRLEGLKIEGNELWGYGRYLPFLAIKGFGKRNSEVKFDHHPVMLDDLAKTLCVGSGVFANCKLYSGFDLLGDDFSGIERATVTMFAVKGPNSDFRFRSHRPITVERGTHILESLYNELSRESGNSPPGQDP